MTTATRNELMTEANTKKSAALKAHKVGDTALCNAFLKQAADRYRAAGNTAWAKWCEQRMA